MVLGLSELIAPPTSIECRGAVTFVSAPLEKLARLRSIDYRALIAELGALHRRGAITGVVRFELPGGGVIDYHLLRDGLFLGIVRDALIDGAFTAPGMCVLRVRLGPFQEQVEDHARESGELDCTFLNLGPQRLQWTYRSAPGRAGSNVAVFFEPEQLGATMDPAARAMLQPVVEAGAAKEPRAHLLAVPPSVPLRRAVQGLLALDVRDPLYPMRVEAGVLDLLAEALSGLARSSELPGSRLDDRDIEALQAVRTGIEADYASHATLDELARTAGMNRRKLTEGFKNLFGTTVHDYRVQRRMHRARELLREGLSAGEVSAEVGYGDQGSFTAAFRRFFGETPGTYRSRRGS